jgi:hypothetical protein
MDQLSRKKNAQAGKRFPMQNNGVVSLVKSIRQNVKLQRSIDKKQVWLKAGKLTLFGRIPDSKHINFDPS